MVLMTRAGQPAASECGGIDSVTTELAAMAECEKVCPQLHLPVQSGADRVLAAMKRGYTTLEYKSIVRRLRVVRMSAAVPTLSMAEANCSGAE